MLSCGGILPGGVFGGTQIQGLQLLNGGVDHAHHVDTGHGHGQQTHGGQHAEAAAHIVGHHKAGPALGVGQGLEHAAVGVGGGENVLVSLIAVLLLQQLTEDTEGDRRLQGGAGLGDDVHVEILVAQLLQNVAEIIRRQAVAGEKYLGVVLAGQGLEQLDGASRAQVGAADTDDHQRLGAAADLLRGLHDGVKLALFDAEGQLHPAGEIGSQAGLFGKSLVRFFRKRVIGAGRREKAGGAGQINFNHNASCKKHIYRNDYTAFCRDFKY